MTNGIISPGAHLRPDQPKRAISMDDLDARISALEAEQRRLEITGAALTSVASGLESLRETVRDHIRAQDKSETRRDRESRRLQILICSVLIVIAIGKDAQRWLVDHWGVPPIADSLVIILLIVVFAWILDRYGFGGRDRE